MDGELDEKVVTMKRSILDMIGPPAAPPPPPVREPIRPQPDPPVGIPAEPEADLPEPLPKPGDRYQASARTANKPLLTLFFLLADQSEEGFSYADLRRVRIVAADKPGDGPVLVLKFVEALTTEVRITGRNLKDLPNLIGGHRIAWLREWPPKKDYIDPRATVITGIRIDSK
jgi:hypothetical protein